MSSLTQSVETDISCARGPLSAKSFGSSKSLILDAQKYKDQEEIESFENLSLIVNLNRKMQEQSSGSVCSDEFISLRNKLVDWMSMVKYTVNLSMVCLHTAVKIFDEVALRFNYNLADDDAYLIALTSLFIASNKIESKPLCLKTVTKDLGNDTFTATEIVSAEALIMSTLDFDVPVDHSEQFLKNVLDFIFSGNNASISYMERFEIFRLISLLDNHFVRQDSINHFALIYFTLINSAAFNQSPDSLDVVKKLNILIKKLNLKAKDVVELSRRLKNLQHELEIDRTLFVSQKYYESLDM